MARKSKLAVKSIPPVIQPVTTTVINPLAIKIALQIADGNPKRLHYNEDGSITVTNK